MNPEAWAGLARRSLASADGTLELVITDLTAFPDRRMMV
jgi:hypothetical protein